MSDAVRGEKPAGLESESGDWTDETETGDRTTRLKSRSSPEPLSLSRCAACYNQKSSSVSWRGDGGESSSSAEDSGPEGGNESEAESSSSSSSSSCGSERPEPERSREAAEDESRGGGGGGGGEDADETGEMSNRQEDKNKSSSLTPRLIPLSLLPRPPQVVSTLHLQVVPQNSGDDETFFNIRQCRPEREEEEETQESYRGGGGGRGRGGRRGRGGGGINRTMPTQPPQYQQMMLPWQQMSQPSIQQHYQLHNSRGKF